MAREVGVPIVITLCGAPDWMKGLEAGRTDWRSIERFPLQEHYEDFTKLAVEVAKRYPDVQYFQIWNEFKGLWSNDKIDINGIPGQWRFEDYTELYNQVYDALKADNPKLKVGGLYLVVEGTGSNKGGWAAEKPIRQRQ
jgi:hypothetical protein